MPQSWISQRVQFSADGERLAALGSTQEPGKIGDGVLRIWAQPGLQGKPREVAAISADLARGRGAEGKEDILNKSSNK